MNLVSDIVAFWQQTWHDNRLLFWLEAIGTVTSMIASSMVALSAQNITILGIGLIIFMIANVVMFIAMRIRQSAWMMMLNVWFCATNIVGLIKICMLMLF